MQHVDYSICKDDKECKHKADKKMVRALDAIPWKERQWGHPGVRNSTAAKQKLGLGIKPQKNIFRELADELHKPLTRRFTRRCVISKHVDLAGVALAFWTAEEGKISRGVASGGIGKWKWWRERQPPDAALTGEIFARNYANDTHNCKMFQLFQKVLRLLGKLSITPVTLFTPTMVLSEDLGPICWRASLSCCCKRAANYIFPHRG